MQEINWVLCPVCGSKTRLKIREDTVLENFPLFCPKCKHETLIAVRNLTRTLYELDGTPHVRVDEYMKHRLQNKLIRAILKDSL